MDIIREFIIAAFGLGLFINAMLFLPQAVKLIKLKEAKELSLITFLGFCIIQALAVAYGVLQKDYILIIGYSLSFITCGMVTVLIIYFKWAEKKQQSEH